MIRFRRGSLAAQFIKLTLGALIVSQALTFLITLNHYGRKFDADVKAEFISRAASVTHLMRALPPEARAQALRASEGSYLRYWLSERDPADPDLWREGVLGQLGRPLSRLVDEDGTIGWAGSSRPQLPTAHEVSTANANEPWRTPTPYLWMLSQPAEVLRFAGGRGFGYKTRLDDGRWLNAAFYQHDKDGSWSFSSSMSLVLMAIMLALISVFIARRIARPLRTLAMSAEAFGRGQDLPPLPEEGPDEIRRTAESFNIMQDRLKRFVRDRAEMLAAVGHDLRTPLTTLRLRAELVGDEDAKRQMVATIDELQSMTEAAISFARGESLSEETRVVDLEALVGSLCDDQADLGHLVRYLEGEKTAYRCRPNSLRRAIRNLIENAVRYGGEATVFLRHTASAVEIVIEDRGPGIPEHMAERVFAPFVRLESSRNRATGGLGLGLSVVRMAVRQHGGDVTFSNGDVGLQAIICLPKEGRPDAAETSAVRSEALEHVESLPTDADPAVRRSRSEPDRHGFRRRGRSRADARRTARE